MLGRENVLNAQGISQPTALEAHPELSAVSVYTGRERLIRSHSSARFSFELSGNSS